MLSYQKSGSPSDGRISRTPRGAREISTSRATCGVSSAEIRCSDGKVLPPSPPLAGLGRHRARRDAGRRAVRVRRAVAAQRAASAGRRWGARSEAGRAVVLEPGASASRAPRDTPRARRAIPRAAASPRSAGAGCEQGQAHGPVWGDDTPLGKPFGWWPIKAYRTCPTCAASGKKIARKGQTLCAAAAAAAATTSPPPPPPPPPPTPRRLDCRAAQRAGWLLWR